MKNKETLYFALTVTFVAISIFLLLYSLAMTGIAKDLAELVKGGCK